jgi:hypothetical protein
MIRTLLAGAAACAVSVAVGVPLASAAERPKAKTVCTATDEPLVYDCTFTLTGRTSGKPIEGARLVINADMPSMPMAHNVRPVHASATGVPGVYKATLTLEMHGEWLLKIRVEGPTRDLLLEKIDFRAKDGPKDGAKGGHKHR